MNRAKYHELIFAKHNPFAVTLLHTIIQHCKNINMIYKRNNSTNSHMMCQQNEESFMFRGKRILDLCILCINDKIEPLGTVDSGNYLSVPCIDIELVSTMAYVATLGVVARVVEPNQKVAISNRVLEITESQAIVIDNRYHLKI